MDSVSTQWLRGLIEGMVFGAALAVAICLYLGEEQRLQLEATKRVVVIYEKLCGFQLK